MEQRRENDPGPATTIERPPLFNLEIEQPENGYRYNRDPFLLSQFIKDHRQQWKNLFAGESLDLGTGVGILPLLLARDFPATRFTGVEIQVELARLAAKNVTRNNLSHQIKIITADYLDRDQKAIFSGRFQTVICNPPYYPAQGGRLNQCPQKRLARHEIASNLKSLIRAAATFLTTRGLFIIIFPAERLIELTSHLKSQRLEPKYLQFIHPKNSDRAGSLLLSARKNGAPGVIIENPLII